MGKEVLSSTPRTTWIETFDTVFAETGETEKAEAAAWGGRVH
jgi:hypothetical protein